ncbi:hypothetical protein AAC387_Pa12g0515 [Persea americana]
MGGQQPALRPILVPCQQASGHPFPPSFSWIKTAAPAGTSLSIAAASPSPDFLRPVHHPIPAASPSADFLRPIHQLIPAASPSFNPSGQSTLTTCPSFSPS